MQRTWGDPSSATFAKSSVPMSLSFSRQVCRFMIWPFDGDYGVVSIRVYMRACCGPVNRPGLSAHHRVCG